MEKKARVKRLNHQDDVKRSWAAAYSNWEDGVETESSAQEGGVPEDGAQDGGAWVESAVSPKADFADAQSPAE
jgi:hypothetical protein